MGKKLDVVEELKLKWPDGIVRGRVANGEEGADIAIELGVSRSCIWSVVHRRTWRNV
jgi:hypothetical protein